MNLKGNASEGHIAVLRNEVVNYLAPAIAKPGTILIDCTTGLGGHTGTLLANAHPLSRCICIDTDARNLAQAKSRLAEYGGRLRFFHANFSDVREVLRETATGKVNAVLADLGFASNQMDDPARGMSFSAEGPLDMRLDLTKGLTAEYIVNTLDENELADIIYHYGEERLSRRIARAIVDARKNQPIKTTMELAQIVSSVMPPLSMLRPKGKKIHPATRTFQALRIAVNDELLNLDNLLDELEEIMAPGGRVAIISFHSLEDRRVKLAFATLESAGKANILTKKPVTPADVEIESNPRCRSAKMRVIEFV
ncbi:MAG TPA: 16S rRNA (cytosine(1402)-N(4))-methyltransferase RsmH [Phycisphaerae bacterium]|mgnify:CR=1 FL=1|nr:16S rRNA (cytosine(1402)-N(4))-methyltransferase RsmH [Phycisphaerae bacterium]HPS53365.1 16S rRNA (cytosine(1402)-N(4))-methyltransferase RsmH [Phycisphaerae bacterium]